MVVITGVNIGTCFLRLWTSVDVVFNYVFFAYAHVCMCITGRVCVCVRGRGVVGV